MDRYTCTELNTTVNVQLNMNTYVDQAVSNKADHEIFSFSANSTSCVFCLIDRGEIKQVYVRNVLVVQLKGEQEE